MNATRPKTNPLARVLALHDFRLLLSGAAASLLGDQFTIIATPWLVLKLTNDPLALGLVLALTGIPRAGFLLFGGAITDRLSPRRVMLIANLTRCLLTGTMAGLVLGGQAQVWMIYAFALLFGIVAGFAIPAENSIVPMLLAEQDLQAGNSLMMGITQLAGFIGPTIAGILIGQYSTSLTGVGLAFAVNAGTFIISAVFLQLISTQKAVRTPGHAAPKENVLAAIRSGIEWMWADKPLRLIFTGLSVVNFLLVGPLMVGIPVLANTRLPEGAAAFGILMSAYAGGNLSGYLIAGSLRRPGGTGMRVIMLALTAGFGIAIGAMGLVTSTWVDALLALLLGLGNGYLAILLFTWIQTRTPQAVLGRMMSLFMLSNTGLAPISQALAGVVSTWSLTGLFIAPGVLVVLVALWMAPQPDLKGIGASLAVEPVRVER